MVQQIDEIGSFEAYKGYTEKYPDLFSAILQHLYMTDLDSLRPMIENVDFSALLTIAESNRASGLMAPIQEVAIDAASMLGADEDFTIYLGLEMGNIGGFSGNPSHQMVFIGTEKPLTLDTIRFMVPHEVNHMVRSNALPDIDFFSFTERVISEGLGPYFSLKVNQLDFTAQGIAKVLFITPDQARNLVDNTDGLLREMLPNFGTQLTKEHMEKYFTFSMNDQPLVLQGYYLGMVICHRLETAGYAVENQTKMPSDLIWQVFNELTK